MNAVENPFSTRYIRPGASEHIFPEGQSVAAYVARLMDCDRGAQIVGPHGSGKSNLLHAIETELAASEIPCVRFTLHDGQRGLPRDDWRRIRAAAGVVVIDGYEQFSFLSRWRLKRLTRDPRRRLLVTAHEDVGFPTLAETAPSVELAERVVARLMTKASPLITDNDVAVAFAGREGNMREMLFDLYDLYEQRARIASLN